MHVDSCEQSSCVVSVPHVTASSSSSADVAFALAALALAFVAFVWLSPIEAGRHPLSSHSQYEYSPQRFSFLTVPHVVRLAAGLPESSSSYPTATSSLSAPPSPPPLRPEPCAKARHVASAARHSSKKPRQASDGSASHSSM